jgi:hypothetical protein
MLRVEYLALCGVNKLRRRFALAGQALAEYFTKACMVKKCEAAFMVPERLRAKLLENPR